MSSASGEDSIVVVIGVAGAGKTTVGRALAAHLRWAFIEGDELHTEASLAKMRAGIALTDRDREPWLRELRQRIDEAVAQGVPTIITCSALKRSYRELLHRDGVRFVFLDVRVEVLRARLAQRKGHFFDADLLDSQLGELEQPEPGRALHVNGERTTGEIVAEIVSHIRDQRVHTTGNVFVEGRDPSGG